LGRELWKCHGRYWVENYGSVTERGSFQARKERGTPWKARPEHGILARTITKKTDVLHVIRTYLISTMATLHYAPSGPSSPGHHDPNTILQMLLSIGQKTHEHGSKGGQIGPEI